MTVVTPPRSSSAIEKSTHARPPSSSWARLRTGSISKRPEYQNCALPRSSMNDRSSGEPPMWACVEIKPGVRMRSRASTVSSTVPSNRGPTWRMWSPSITTTPSRRSRCPRPSKARMKPAWMAVRFDALMARPPSPDDGLDPRSRVLDAEDLGDQRRPLLPLHLHHHLGGEADTVAAVVDAALPLLDLQELRHQPREERQRQVAVGDRLASGHLLLRPLDVHVDPLVVARRVRELVDHGLVHGDPLGRAERLADVLLQVFRRLDDEHGGLLDRWCGRLGDDYPRSGGAPEALDARDIVSAEMSFSRRRKTVLVDVGGVGVGSERPIVVQSMTNTDTADIAGTVAQVNALHAAGSELVRVTVNNDAAAQAVPEIVAQVDVPVIGDFHYNGHLLLTRHPACAAALAKYRINPGNVGTRHRDANFRAIVEVAIAHGKPVRIGVNWGSLDQQLLTEL